MVNNLARDVLVRAALAGVPQITETLRDENGGFCAVGVLCAAIDGWEDWEDWERKVQAHYDISYEELLNIVIANDKMGWDFLTIARKIGVQDDLV